MLELNNVINQRYPADIDGSPQANTKVYTFFSAAHGTFSNIDPIFAYVGHTESLERLRVSGSGSLL